MITQKERLRPLLTFGDEGVVVPREEMVVAGCYAPGLVCMVCEKQTLHAGLILREEGGEEGEEWDEPAVTYRLAGMDCASYVGVQEVAAWRAAIEAEVAFGGQEYDAAWQAGAQRRTVERLVLVCALEQNRSRNLRDTHTSI